jgi:hypothetical protein
VVVAAGFARGALVKAEENVMGEMAHGAAAFRKGGIIGVPDI